MLSGMEITIGIVGTIIIFVLLMIANKLADGISAFKKTTKYCPEPVKPFEGTTTLPPGLAATACSHQWEVIKDEILKNDQRQKMVTILQCRSCGSIDKTIEDIEFTPPPPPPKPVFPPEPKSECRHSWEEKKAASISSAYEQLAANSPCKPGSFSKKEIPEDKIVHSPWFFKKTYVCERVCSKCGEIRTTIASNYELKDLPMEAWGKESQSI